MAETCFVVGPFGEERTKARTWSDFLLTNIITPAVDDRYEPKRSIDFPPSGDVLEDIVREQLETAPLVIADLSDGNANSFYELGIRQAIGMPCALVCRKDSLPGFNLSHQGMVMIDATYDSSSGEYVLRSPARVVAELKKCIEQAKRSRRGFRGSSYQLMVYAWTVRYSRTIHADWLEKAPDAVRTAIQSYEGGGGAPTIGQTPASESDRDLRVRFAEYRELKDAANQRWEGQLFYLLDMVNNDIEFGHAVFKFATGSVVIEAGGRHDTNGAVMIDFTQPERELALMGHTITLPSYDYSVTFLPRSDRRTFDGKMYHPDTGSLIGSTSLKRKIGVVGIRAEGAAL